MRVRVRVFGQWKVEGGREGVGEDGEDEMRA